MSQLPDHNTDIKQLQQNIHSALRAWGELTGTPQNLLESLVLVKQQRANITVKSPAALRLATNQVLHKAINELKTQDFQGAQILEARFLDGDTVLMAAHKLNLSKDQIKRYQKKAIEYLANVVLDQETAVRTEQLKRIEAQLTAPTYTQLFGVESQYQKLLAQLYTANAPWITILTGIGGIGKTSLADAAIREVMSSFRYEHVVWLRVNATIPLEKNASPAHTLENLITKLSDNLLPDLPPSTSQQVRYEQIRRVLKATPHLIVIDNLEIEADTAYLLDYLIDWANPSKFVLTARTRPSNKINIAHISLEELSLEAATGLIRNQANNVGLSDLAQLTPADAHPIYDVTGGNPLAIKLLVGLATTLPLRQVLNDLKRAKSEEVEQMYHHIYWQAWHSLTPDSQALLEMMVLASDTGIEPEAMAEMSLLSTEQLWPAISELASRSLLEVQGTTWQRRYRIHRLTETFLQTEIIHWPKKDT